MCAWDAGTAVLEEDTLHRWFAAAEGVQSVRNVNQYGIREFTSLGANASGVIGVLAGRLGLKNAHAVMGTDNAMKWTSACTPHRPGIFLIQWYALADGMWRATDVLHWVVVVGMVGADLICLDPLAGMVPMTPKGVEKRRYVILGPPAQMGRPIGLITTK